MKYFGTKNFLLPWQNWFIYHLKAYAVCINNYLQNFLLEFFFILVIFLWFIVELEKNVFFFSLFNRTNSYIKVNLAVCNNNCLHIFFIRHIYIFSLYYLFRYNWKGNLIFFVDWSRNYLWILIMFLFYVIKPLVKKIFLVIQYMYNEIFKKLSE